MTTNYILLITSDIGAKFDLNRSAEAKVDLEYALSLAKQNDDDALIRWILNLLDEINTKTQA